ncbi:MAG TPA: hypothetical protein VHM70_11295 [Polyangiaceae bacterium]|nr:hypothetical protein [Polyangiaceae bacterium]
MQIRRLLASERGDYALLALGFVLSRLVLLALGLRFNLDLSWMFLSDPADLRRDLLRTVFYFHAFPPGFDLITGVLLRLPDSLVPGAAHLLLSAFSACLCLSVLALGKYLGLGRKTRLCLAFAFCLAPPTLFFENLYLYTIPSTALLCLSSVLWYRGLRKQTARAWFWCFLTGAILGWIRSTFHLVWLVLIVLLTLPLLPKASRKNLLVGAVGPVLLLASLYIKNYVVFGVFGATSWGGANIVAITTTQMPRALKHQWVLQGKLSPFSEISVFAPPKNYLGLLPDLPTFPWPTTNELERPSVGAGNFNHGLYLEVNKRRKADAATFMSERPADYLRNVLTKSLPQFFEPTTHWHPKDKEASSPHSQHRRVLGGFENAYNWLLHQSIPLVAPFGLYCALPLVLVWVFWRVAKHLIVHFRARDSAPSQRLEPGLLLAGYLAFQIVFVAAPSVLFTLGECARYRYMVEAMIWLLTAWLVEAGLKLREGASGRVARNHEPAV